MYTVVFDIGKTNKKVYVFAPDASVVASQSARIPEVADEDGYACDDLHAITVWVDERLHSYLLDPRYFVTRVNFSTYGASLVHVGADGRPLTPLYSYLRPIDREPIETIYLQFGGQSAFHTATGSPPLEMLNSGFQLAWLARTRPKVIARTRRSLHLPQYLAYRYTGRAVSEYTSLGCHTAMWDYPAHAYHPWLGWWRLRRLLPDPVGAGTRQRVSWRGYRFEVGVGLHDSSAALLPYLRDNPTPFVLLSTGTWSIAINAWNQRALEPEDLARDCLLFMAPDGRAVRASRLFLGYEHDLQADRLAVRYRVDRDSYKRVPFDPSLAVTGQPHRHDWEHLVPLVEVAPPSAEVPPDSTFAAAYHRLVSELVELQVRQLRLVVDDAELRHLVIDGGFADNAVFAGLLRLHYPLARVECVSDPLGSALGAYLV